jgi:hypothetical protein
MKKLLTVLLTCGLLLMLCQLSFAAIHPENNDFINWSSEVTSYESLISQENDKWFDCTQTQPSLSIEAVNWVEGDLTYKEMQELNVNYYVNDQTFADIDYMHTSGSNSEIFGGSYLFDSGVFVGVDYINEEDSDSNPYDLSLGYRFNLGKKGYIAVSGDYYHYDGYDDSDIGGYEVDGIYYLDKAKLFGEMYLAKDNDSKSKDFDDFNYLMVGANTALSDELTVGAKFESQNNYGENTTGYLTGLTWSKDKIIINSKFGKDLISQLNYSAIGGSYSFNKNWSLGATYGIYDLIMEDPGYAVKLTYKTGMMKFSFTVDKDYYRNMNWMTMMH